MLGDVLLDVEEDDGKIWKVFYCEGCKSFHQFQLNIAFPVSWSFDGKNDCPSFSPSMLIKMDGEIICHLQITDGMIKYFDDCKHEFAGLTIPMSCV